MRPDLLALASSMSAREERFALVTVVRREPPSSARVGDAALITASGEYHGWAGGGCTRETVVREALRAMADGEPRFLSLSPAAGAMDYYVPSSMECPSWETGHTVTPSPHHPFGAKGVGESATVGAPPAIANAVVDALKHLGVTHIDIPITPEKVWTLLKEKGAAE